MSNKWIQNSLKIFYYLKRVGVKGAAERLGRSLRPKHIEYTQWIKKYGIEKRKKTWDLKQIAETKPDMDLIILCDVHKDSNMYASIKDQLFSPQNIYKDINQISNEYVVLIADDVELEQDALWHFHLATKEHPEADLFYPDHDVKGTEHVFKPDFNYDLLLSYNYIGNVVVMRRQCLQDIMAKSDIGSTTIYEMILRAIESGRKISHIPIVLYHKADNNLVDDGKTGRKIVEDHLKRMGYNVDVRNGRAADTQRVIYLPMDEPLVSILIPNKDHVDDLKKCLQSIEKQSYKNYEVIIIENNSQEKRTFDYYKELVSYKDSIRILYWRNNFNYSLINNFAAEEAKGDYYLLLNNDIEFKNPDAIRDMLGICMRRDVGIVGAKLYYPDETIQHAGVILGYGGIAGHAFLGCSGIDSGYMNRIDCCQNFSAVTAACMMVRQEVFHEVSGFDGELQVAFNDVDFCLRVLHQGYRIVYTPYAEAWHYESKTRGNEDNYKKIKRFNQEVDLLRSRWQDMIRQGDPAYNPNLSLYKWDFSLKQ